MDLDKINEEEVLNKIQRHISGNTPVDSFAKPSHIPNNFNEDIFRALSILRQVKDPSHLPQDTRFRFFKRIVHRLLRPFTRGQVEFNRIATDILNGLTGNIQQVLHLYQLNQEQYNERIDHIQSVLDKQSESIEEIRENLIKKTNEYFDTLTKQIETTRKNLLQEMDRFQNALSTQMHDGINLLHKRIEDEKNSTYSVLESARQNLKHQITTEKESIHDRINHVLQSLHQRIDDEKRGIYDSVPGFGFVEQKIQEAKDHSRQLAELIDKELRAVEGRFNPAEIYRLYQEQNNITDEIYFELEKNFRGTDECIVERQDFYRNLIASHHAEMKEKDGFYLDVGCGRGELLNLLRNNDIPARGIDINQQMVEKCREMDLAVYREDAISYLKTLPDGELRGVIALQVIEHLSIKSLFELLYLIHGKLKPGGILVLETINPESLYALRWFYLDYTHNKPLPAPLVQFFIYMAGFPQAEIILRSPVEGWKQMSVTGNNQILDDNFNKINNFLFGYQDYAIRAIK
jgi:O-antigen chain-terminating methyltransferase